MRLARLGGHRGFAVKHLVPTKARILMMLALTKTQKPSDVQKLFDSY